MESRRSQRGSFSRGESAVAAAVSFSARASEEVGEATQAINAYQKVLLLDPPDPADVHYRLARLLHKGNDSTAKRHVLQALEEAPRFRNAHRLLLELAQVKSESTNSALPKAIAP